jgi:hypothetical protein
MMTAGDTRSKGPGTRFCLITFVGASRDCIIFSGGGFATREGNIRRKRRRE